MVCLRYIFWIFLLLGMGMSYARAQHIVGGRVSDAEGKPLAGASVKEKGTGNITLTDSTGNFRINLADGRRTLAISSVGYAQKEVNVEGRVRIDILLDAFVEELDGVVVTALGITRSKKALGYSVDEVKGEEFVRVPQENIMNALSGKVPGLAISSTSGPGSSVSMVVRGMTSLSSDNQPLFVVDGVPVGNTVNNVSAMGNRNTVDYGNAIASINPDDIASLTVLKGASAAALYGSRAANGVILINTKNGRETDRIRITFTSNTVVDRPYRFLDFQSKFGSGQFSPIPVEISGNPLTNHPIFGGLVNENIAATYGGELDKGYTAVQWNSPRDENGIPIPTPLVSYPDNARNFVQNALTASHSLALANSSESVHYRASYSNMAHRGLIPGTDLKRNTLNLNGGIAVADGLRLSTTIDLSRNNADNRPAGDRGANPLEEVYALSPHINILDMRDYWMPGMEGLRQRVQSTVAEVNNPWFLAHEVKNGFLRDRLQANIRADWQIATEWAFMVRYGLGVHNESRETKLPVSYVWERNGGYGLFHSSAFANNADLLATYARPLGDFSLAASAGGSIAYNESRNTGNSTNGGGLIVPGVYALHNILPDNLAYSSGRVRQGTHSIYGMANLGWRDMAFLDLTARSDWSSTLPNADPYFYPSASLSLIANELVGLRSPFVDLVKLRGSYAQVGNGAGAYQLVPVLANYGTWGGIPRLGLPSTRLIPDLKPEISRSYETGVDISLFKSRLRLSGTIYRTVNENQIFPTERAPSSGVTNANINAGRIQSRGVEISFGVTPVKTTDWHWDIDLNLARNRTRILELTDDMPFYRLWGTSEAGGWTYVGEEIGDIYGTELITVDHPNYPQYQGYPLLDNTGKWQYIDAEETRNKIGNFNPDFVMGGQTSLSYKNWSLQMTFDWRSGGDFYSETLRRGEEGGRSNRMLDKLLNRGIMSDRELRDYLVANEDGLIRVVGNHFPLVGGPTPEYNGYPFVLSGNTVPYGGVFVPGIRQTGTDGNGDPIYVENLGENINDPNGTLTLPYAGATTWRFPQSFLFPADFLKLREISITYRLPAKLLDRWKPVQGMNISVFSRNIMLWTKAKINIDPENAFKPSPSVQGNGMQFLQGVEQFNVNPWVMPIGARLQLTF